MEAEKEGWTLQDMYNRNDKFESKGFELKLTYAYNIFSTTFGYTQIDTNEINSDTGGVLDIK